MTAAVFGALFAAGVALIVFSGALVRGLRAARAQRAARAEQAPPVEVRRAAPKRRLGPVAVVQLVGAVGGGLLGWAATGLLGMVLLGGGGGGLGALLPPLDEVVDLHRSKTEAVVQLRTQTIALLG